MKMFFRQEKRADEKAKNQKGYYYVYYLNPKTRKRTKTSLKTKNKNEAAQEFVKFKRKYEIKNEQGIHSLTVAEFLEIFQNHKKGYITKRRIKTYQRVFNNFSKFVGEKIKLDEITQKHIDDYRNYLNEQSLNISSINVYLTLIFSGLNYAKENNYIFNKLVKPKIKIPHTEKNFLTKEELLILLSNCEKQDLKDIISTAFMTGMRKSEIINLRWEQINLEKNIFTLDNKTHLTKTREVRIISLADDVIEIVKNRFTTRTCGYVFTYKSKKWSDYLFCLFKKLARQTFGKDTEINFHALRHSFASNLISAGVSYFIVKELLGHKDIKTTQIYAHLKPNTLHNAIKAINISNPLKKGLFGESDAESRQDSPLPAVENNELKKSNNKIKEFSNN